MEMNNKKNIILEEYENEFSYKKSKTNLDIQFNRIAFIFFVFLVISVIYSIQLLHLGSLKKENIRPLKSELEDVLLEFNYLSSPEKLVQYQTQYFEKDLIKIEIMNIKEIFKNNETLEIKDLISKNGNE